MIYYVSNSGLDTNNGTSSSTPWKTIVGKVNTTTFTVGDSILFNKGDTWREQLNVTASGNSTSSIVYGAYGTGNRPRIIGSKTTTWTAQGSNIWKSDITFTNPDLLNEYSGRTVGVEHSPVSGSTDYQGCEIFFELLDGSKLWGIYRGTLVTLTANYQWAWITNYMYIYYAGNPNTDLVSVEIPQRSHIINLNQKNYITIDGLGLFYSGRDCITMDSSGNSYNGTGLLVNNCEIGYVSTKGSGAGYGVEAWYSNAIFRNNEFHDCGRRAISYHVAYESGFTVSNVLIEKNYFHDGWHTTGPDFNVGSGTAGINGVIIRRNRFYDTNTAVTAAWEWSEHMFLQNYSYSTTPTLLQNFYIYSNIFISPKANSINAEAGTNINIFHNTFVNHNLGTQARAHLWIDADVSSIISKNNIFYSNATSDAGGCEVFVLASVASSKLVSNYNLYWRTSATGRVWEKEGTQYNRTQIAAVRSAQLWDINSPTPADPLFVSTTDYHIQTTSPAKGYGLAMTVDSNFDGLDYDGVAFNTSTPSIGAFEYPTGPSTTVNSNILWYPEALNIKSFTTYGDYVTFKFYTSSANRTAETSSVLIFTAPIVYNTITTLSGHTRTTTQQAASPQTVYVTGIPSTYSTLYMDTFISDSSGNRLINLGTKANGYTTITFV